MVGAGVEAGALEGGAAAGAREPVDHAPQPGQRETHGGGESGSDTIYVFSTWK